MKIFITFLFATLAFKSVAQNYRLDQQKLSKFEMGVGASWLSIPYYPGSSERRDIFAPYPTFIYRGDTIRADEDGGLRGRFFKNERLEVNSSIGFFLPVSSDDVQVRAGMNDIGALVEGGPGVIYHIIPRTQKSRFSLSLNLGLRAAIETDLDDTRFRGLIINPMLYSWFKVADRLVLFNSISTTASTKDHQEHFYEVRPEFGNSNRKAYEARGGFFSHNIASFALYTPTDSYTFFGGAVYQDFRGTANLDSPLHQSDSFFSAVFGMTYWFYQSDS